MAWTSVLRLWPAAAMALIALAAPAFVNADPVNDLINPPHEMASILPTPLADPFYQPAPGFEKAKPGAVLASRPANLLFPPNVDSTEMLVRSTDAKGGPAAVVATLFVPRAPWTGQGKRPLIVDNWPISSLGNDCAPSQRLKKRIDADQMPMALMLLARNYAVIVPDHQGLQQAYAAGRMGGHADLDVARAALRSGYLDLEPKSPIVLAGYSGGAIATGWAAQMAPQYAPELHLVGALIGGMPANYKQLHQAMNGTAATAAFLGGALGLVRAYPEMMPLLNDNGWRLAHAFRDSCVEDDAPFGALGEIKVEQLTNAADPLGLPVVQKVLADNKLGATAPKVPIFLYHGANEFWIPLAGVQTVYQEWCQHNAQVRMVSLPGEHFIVGAISTAQTAHWVDQMLAGQLVPAGCTTS